MNALAVFLAACAAVSLGTLAITLRNLRLFAPPPNADASDDTLVSVCIPCRNGERNVEAVVESVLASWHRGIEVLVYDDESTDATAGILARLREAHDRVRSTARQPLPPGWVGKQHACHQMSKAANGD